MVVRAQIRDLTSGPISSTMEHKNKGKHDGKGPSDMSYSFEISREEFQVEGCILSREGRTSELMARKTKLSIRLRAKV